MLDLPNTTGLKQSEQNKGGEVMSAIDFINQKYDIKEDHSPRIDLPFELDLNVNVTAIIGGSGTGKTTLLRKWFNTKDVTFEVDSDMSIFEKLCKEKSDEEYERVSKLLFDVGLSSVPHVEECIQPNFKWGEVKI